MKAQGADASWLVFCGVLDMVSNETSFVLISFSVKDSSPIYDETCFILIIHHKSKVLPIADGCTCRSI
jgi:hypothetical protein